MNFDFVRWMRTCSREELGAFGERLWGNVIRSAGVDYIYLANLKGGAPMQQGSQKLILPDFDLANHRYSMFADSKAKRHPVLYRNANEIRQGIPLHCFSHYREIAQQRGKPCAIALFEAFTDESKDYFGGTLLFATLSHLGSPFPGMGPMADTVFWPRRKFRIVGTISVPQAAMVASTPRPIDLPQFRESLLNILDDMAARPIQKGLF